MNTQILGLVTATTAAIFLMTLTRDLPPNPALVCLIAVFFFAGYTGVLTWRHFKLIDIETSETEDDALFEVYLADRSWAQDRFGFITRITAGFALAIWFLA